MGIEYIHPEQWELDLTRKIQQERYDAQLQHVIQTPLTQLGPSDRNWMVASSPHTLRSVLDQALVQEPKNMSVIQFMSGIVATKIQVAVDQLNMTDRRSSDRRDRIRQSYSDYTTLEGFILSALIAEETPKVTLTK